jgi:hypothetical protein
MRTCKGTGKGTRGFAMVKKDAAVAVESSELLKRFSPLLVLLVVVAVLATSIGIYIATPRFHEKIATIEVSSQTSGGISTINYSPVLAVGVDWDNISADEREQIARYAVNEAIAKAEQSGVTGFNVLGVTQAERRAIFIYSGGESLTLFEGDSSRGVLIEG